MKPQADAPAKDAGAWPSLALNVANERHSLEPARIAVVEFLATHAVGPQTVFKVELVLEEMLMNAIWHAFPEGGLHPIGVVVRLVADRIELHFEDDGVAFDPLGRPLPVAPTSIDEARPGGLGLQLVRKAARALAYERRDGRNHVRVDIARQAA